jgi:hypothetical protein
MSLEQDSDTPNFIDTEFEEVKRLKRSRSKGAHGLGGSSESREFVESFLKDGIDSLIPDPGYKIGVGGGEPPPAGSPGGFPEEYKAAGKDLIRHWSLVGEMWKHPPGLPDWPLPDNPPPPGVPWGWLPPSTDISCRQRGGTAQMCGVGEFSGHVSTPPRFYRRRVKSGAMNFIRSPDNTCDQPTTPGNMDGVKRGAFLALIGHAEFASPSSPPNFYRRKTWSGATSNHMYNDLGCTSAHNICVLTESGAYAWNAAGTIVENDGQYTHPSPCNPSGTSAHGVNDGPLNWGRFAGESKTQTVWALTDAGCVPDGQGGGARAFNTITSQAVLTDPDSETDAINRWLATSPAWGGSSTCQSSTWCMARYEQRTTAAFNYQESKYNITKSGLANSKTYHVTVDVYRSPYGAGTFTLLQTLVLSGTTDGSGNLAINDQIVPNLKGYDTYVTNCVILLNDNTTDTWDYTRQYSPVDCSFTTVNNNLRTVDGVVDPIGPDESDYCIGAGATTETKTATTRTLTGNNTCVLSARTYDDPFPYVKVVGTVTETLSDEDTETDAIGRLLAGAGGVWGSWNPVGDGTGGTCLPSACCLTSYQIRTSGDSFAYEEAQWKAEWASLQPSPMYFTQLHVMRRVYGINPYVAYQTMLISGTSDALGNLELIVDVPNLRGYDTYLYQ